MRKGPPEPPIEKCRNCKHFDYQHSEWPGTDSTDTYYPCLEILGTTYDKDSRTIKVIKRCDCNNYEPLDNLKYLEMKAYEKPMD